MENNNKSYVMPVKVYIFERPETVTNFYDENHARLIDIREIDTDPSRNERKSYSIDSNFFLSLLQINDEQALMDFTKANPHLLLFSSRELYRWGLYTEYVTIADYVKRGVKLLDIFRSYMTVMELFPKRDSLDWNDLRKLYYRTVLLSYWICSKKAFDEHMQQEFDKAVFSVLGSASNITPHYEISFIHNRPIIVGVNGSVTDDLKQTIFAKYIHNYINYHENIIRETLQKQASHFIPRIDLETMSINLYCDTILEAMYAMLVLSMYNNDTYRKCAHKGCEKYFVVDKTHPQTRCPEHMKSRQTRRNNAVARKVRGDKESLVKQKERQALAISNAEVEYQETGDIEAFIKFWEELWASKKGLMSQNNDDAFTLADLYDEVGRYDDALKFVKKIGREECFSERAKEYEEALLKKVQRQKQKIEHTKSREE